MYNNVIFTRLSDNVALESYNDFGFLLSHFELEIPEVQTNYIDVVGRDGSIDLTEILGQVNYKNRDLNLTFTDPNHYINRSIINYLTSLEVIEIRLIETHGGYLIVRFQADGNYLDYLSDSPYAYSNYRVCG